MSDALHDIPACAGCGTCCRLLVELAPGDDVPEAYVAEHDGIRCMDQDGDGTCVALDRATKLCTIYERRPATCRIFERGSGLCRRVLMRYGVIAEAECDNSPTLIPRVLPGVVPSEK